jgi:gliding motility-associated lipoprotein GldD
MVKSNSTGLIIFIVLLSTSLGCRQVSVPKPRGHFRIDLPKREYMVFNDSAARLSRMPFTFEYPVYAHLSFTELNKAGNNPEPGWFNIEFPGYRAKIYLTYKDVKNDLNNLLEQTYKINVKSHMTKADAINEQVISNEPNKVYGVLYDLKGNTASAVQFYVTDSLKHYLRGSLYFDAEPDADSLAPVIDFFREDIIHIIETLKWRN